MLFENDSLLGKSVNYCDTYSPSLLFPIRRKEKREEIGINEKQLPFHGVDIWNVYELSWLNSKGKPLVAIAELHIPSTSTYLIESKSLKLYFNSLNQTRFSSLKEVEDIINNDLSKAANTHITSKLTLISNFETEVCADPSGECLDNLDIEIDTYEVTPSFLQRTESGICEEQLYSNLLKSNCLVTGQPDWATLVIHYIGQKIDHEGLLKYIISFRKHNEFHEQCIERIFVDITEHCSPEKLTVYGRYTRRGGLDINPFRSNWEQVPENIRLARQ